STMWLVAQQDIPPDHWVANTIRGSSRHGNAASIITDQSPNKTRPSRSITMHSITLNFKPPYTSKRHSDSVPGLTERRPAGVIMGPFTSIFSWAMDCALDIISSKHNPNRHALDRPDIVGV
ncbi:MAG: hypothetical protein PHF66_09955, partial [Desulfobacteraceae bacterium]|nr:hypothetical protein [Desulfobacteraceae bacterium]